MWEPCLSGDCVHIKPRSRVETPLERCWKVPISYLMKLATWQPHTVSVQVWRRYGQLADCIQSAKTWKKRGSGSIHISSPLCEWYQYISQEHNMFEFPKRLCNLSFFLQSFGEKKNDTWQVDLGGLFRSCYTKTAAGNWGLSPAKPQWWRREEKSRSHSWSCEWWTRLKWVQWMMHKEVSTLTCWAATHTNSKIHHVDPILYL